MSPITVIGIDCAVQPKKTGLALAEMTRSGTRVLEVATGKDVDPASQVTAWLERMRSGVIALDAPLGWPVGLARSLGLHLAGEPLQTGPELMFRRETDRVVKRRIGKQPLDVGADRIARTAHAACELLADVRSRTRRSIPLIWGWGHLLDVGAIEVYPAATLTVRNLRNKGYKGKHQQAVRAGLLEALQGELTLGVGADAVTANADVFDAVICILAAQDFLAGRAAPPGDLAQAKREGWIWVRA